MRGLVPEPDASPAFSAHWARRQQRPRIQLNPYKAPALFPSVRHSDELERELRRQLVKAKERRAKVHETAVERRSLGSDTARGRALNFALGRAADHFGIPGKVT